MALSGASAFVQNADPYTFFRKRPVRLMPGAGLHTGTLSGVVLDRANAMDLPTVLRRILSGKATVAKHRRVTGFEGARELVIRSGDERPLPVQVDGDYVGEHAEAVFGVEPGGLRVVS